MAHDIQTEARRLAELITAHPPLPHRVAIAMRYTVARFGWIRTLRHVAKAGAGLDRTLDACLSVLLRRV